MSDLPIWAQGLALLGLLLLSGYFSMSETSLMAINRYRMRHLANQGRRGARLVLKLLGKTDQLLATILIGNNLVNAALTTLITALAIQTFGNNDEVLAIATAVAASLLIVFAEIFPKVIGANRPERVAMGSSHLLILIVGALKPLVALVNGLVSGLLALVNLKSTQRQEGLTTEEFRAAVLESSAFIPSEHRKIMLNLFDLEDLTVDDVMVPRGKIEALDLEDDEAALREQISTCFHNKLPVYRGELNQMEGILHVRKALALLSQEAFSKEALQQALAPAYFVPAGTKLFTQMQFFQESSSRLALVVDEYGEVEGLVTLQDLVGELVGEVTTQGPSSGQKKKLDWDEDGTVSVDGVMLVRELNRRLDLNLPVDGPKTINGLILEALQDLPEAPLSVKVGGVPLEIQQLQGRVIRRVLVHRPVAGPNPADQPQPS